MLTTQQSAPEYAKEIAGIAPDPGDFGAVLGAASRSVTLKVKFNDFEIVTRSRSLPVAVSSRGDLARLSIALLQNEMPLPKPVRLLGVSLSALQGEIEAEPQLGLPI